MTDLDKGGDSWGDQWTRLQLVTNLDKGGGEQWTRSQRVTNLVNKWTNYPTGTFITGTAFSCTRLLLPRLREFTTDRISDCLIPPCDGSEGVDGPATSGNPCDLVPETILGPVQPRQGSDPTCSKERIIVCAPGTRILSGTASRCSLPRPFLSAPNPSTNWAPRVLRGRAP